ncbi:hypothetical protein ACOBR2_11820 [Telmatobacter bradus]|uniref:hypothetical protein n=1 Tax=Telmatobacter bradus TaxID=474953 RepID=UPI003B438939
MLSRFADLSFTAFLLLVSVPALTIQQFLFRQAKLSEQPATDPRFGSRATASPYTQLGSNTDLSGEDAIAAYEELIDSTLRGKNQ